MKETTRGRILHVDDDRAVAMVLKGLMRQAGYDAEHVASGPEALRYLERHDVDLVILDMRMPEMDGMDVLGVLQRERPELPVIMLTAHGTVPLAVEAMQRGAVDFILKPFDRDELLYAVEKALALSARVRHAPPAVDATDAGELVVGAATERLIDKAAQSDVAVLIRGESGAGKEVVAREIHRRSARREGPFVVVHCASIPEQLLESELFGYEKGAFTGAAARKPGRLELADGGTLLLDELGDIPLSIQVKLLRVVQDKTFEPLGGRTSKTANLRILAATHRDLEQQIQDGTFREDLFYRVSVLPLVVPPLRERPEVIPVLVDKFRDQYVATYGARAPVFSAEALAFLQTLPWRGNVRELANVVERVLILSDEPTISRRAVEAALEPHTFSSPKPTSSEPVGTGLDALVAATELEAVQDALRRTGGNKSAAARLLGVSRRTLYNKLAAAEKGGEP